MEGYFLDMENRSYPDGTQPSVEELNRTRKDRVAARKKAKKQQKRDRRRAQRKQAMASGKKRRRKVNKIALVFVLVVVVGFLVSARRIMNLRSENVKLKKQNQQLEEKRDELKDELKNVNSREYIEKRAREQLRLVNPDEIIFVFPNE